MPLRRNVRRQQPTHRLHLVERGLNPRGKVKVNARRSDDASGCRRLGQHRKRRPRMRPQQELGIEAATRCTRGGRLGVRQSFLAGLYFRRGRFVCGNRGNDLGFESRRLLLSPRQCLPSRRDSPQRAPQGDFEGLCSSELAPHGLDLHLQTRRHVAGKGVASNVSLRSHQPLQLVLEGFNPFRASEWRLRRP